MLAIDVEEFADRFSRSDERETRIARHGRTVRRESAVFAPVRPARRIVWAS